MKTLANKFGVVLVLLLVGGCTSLPWNYEAVDTTLGGMAKTRNQSPGDAILGAYGFKRNTGEFERQGVIDWKNVGNYEATVISITEAEYIELGGSVDASAANAGANVDSKNNRTYRAVLLQLRSLDTLVQELNDELAKDGHVRTVFYSPTARIVSSVVKVYDHKAYANLIAGATVQGPLNPSSLNAKAKITVEGGSERDISLADGQVGAYQLVRACWHKNTDVPKVGLVIRDNPGNDTDACERESVNRFGSQPPRFSR